MRHLSLHWLSKLLVTCVLFAGMAALNHWGATAEFENKARNIAFALTGKAASGQLHIVEMDAASVAAIERWPWSRGHHALLIDQLNDAGVRSITFDVDFSSDSDPVEDAKLAAALKRANGLVALPTFSQNADHSGTSQIDSLPSESLRENVSLASVSVLPDSDGIVREMPLGTMTASTPRPSLSAHIAGRSGSIGSSFPIDYSIDPNTIPRHSFVAIERGNFVAEQLKGKDIIIGATAVEMGDRYVVPRHGVLPGVVVQALAAETLYSGVPTSGGWLTPLIIGSLFAIWLMFTTTIHRSISRGVIAVSAVLLATWLIWAFALVAWDIIPAIGAIVGATAWQSFTLKRQENRAKRLIDTESGLPNRRALDLAQEEQSSGFTVAAMIEDFDALRSVLGEEQVGQFISRLSERLSVASGSATIHRIDHRVLAWASELEHYELEDSLSGLSAIMRSPIEVGGRRVDVKLGLGIAEKGLAAEASHAARQALKGGVPWRYHQAAEREALEEQISLMGELDAAIERKELLVLYQPKFDLSTSKITSVEALVRWEHPERGRLRPDTFIPLAEESDRISNLTLYVLEQTIADLLQWKAQGLTLTAAVNISARLVSSKSFMATVVDLLEATDLPAQQLIFEVTESASMDNPEAAIASLNRLRDFGVSISMDDYGTGKSTLNYLQTLPLSELKIDRSFVQYANRETNDALLVRSTVNLAHQMGLTVVAEGVENGECLDFLREIGCDYAQGYYVARPMDAAPLAELVSETNAGRGFNAKHPKPEMVERDGAKPAALPQAA